MLKSYTKYLKTNPEGYWFKKKLYGWGWVPVKWQGWVAVWIYIFVFVKIFIQIDSKSHSGSDTLIGVFIPFVILTGILMTICFWKGEKPHWQWGPPKD